MLYDIANKIIDKFGKYKNLYSMDMQIREDYYKEIEVFQDAYNFFKTHSEEKNIPEEKEIEILDFFKFLYILGDFLTPLNFKDILILFKNKENQINFSFLLINCTYFFEDLKIYENLLSFLEKNYDSLKDEQKFEYLIKNGLFYLIKGEIKFFEKQIEKARKFGMDIDKDENNKFKNQYKLAPIETNKEILGFLKIDEKFEELDFENIIKNYDKNLKEGNSIEEKFSRNLLEKYLKENSLKISELNKLTEFLSRIDTYFLKDHNREVKDMVLRICEAGKKIWDKNLDMEKIERGSYFHDLGKISIPWVLMDKKISLNEKEREVFKNHSNFSSEILKKAGLEEESIYVLDHHKYLNGKGYPLDNLKPTFEGNMICLAESFIGAINLSSKSKVREKEELFIEFKQLKNIYFYPEIVDALLLIE